MAEQFDTARVTLQPTAPEQPIQSNVLEQGASVFGQAAAQNVGAASAAGQRASGYFAQANAAFDRTVDQYNKIAVMNAQDEAPGLIQKDGNGQIIPPKSFWPSGIHSAAYAQAYSEAARSTYRTMAASEFSNFVSETQAKFPTDPVAFKKAVDEKQNLMLQNLDTREAPFISLRLQQIGSQGATQVAVNLQAANNATLKAQSDVSYGAIVDTASRLAGITAPIAAFGGKDNPAAPGAIKTITDTLPPELQQRVTSADRTPEHNAQVGGAKDSAHLKPGTAVDIGTAGMTDEQKKALVSQVLSNPNLRGIGFYDDHIHIDTGHDKHTVWGTVPGSVQNDVRTWQGAPTAMAAIPTSTDIEKIKTQVASSALVAGMLADWQKQVGPIMTPGEIARKKDELAYTVVAKSYAETFKSGRYDDGKGNVDQGKIALANDQIEKIAAAFPGREAAVRQTLQEGLQFSVGQSGRYAAQQQLDDKRKIEPAQRRAMDLALQADALKNTDIDGARRITDQLRSEARAALTNPSINDAAALQLAQTYYANGNLAKSSMQEGITNKLQGLVSLSTDQTGSVTVQQKASAVASLQAIQSDPSLAQHLTAGQKSYAQGAVDTYYKTQTANDFTAAYAVATDPNSGASPQMFRDKMRPLIEKGQIGPGGAISTGQYLEAEANVKKVWEAKQNEGDLAASYVARTQAGIPTTEAEQKAYANRVPFKVNGQAPSLYNPDDPTHRAALTDYLAQGGPVPDKVKTALAAISHSPDAAKMDGALQTYQSIYASVQRQLEKQGTPGQAVSVDMVKAKTAALVGSEATYLENVRAWGADGAYKLMLADKTSTSKTGQAGGPADSLDSDMATGLSNITGAIQANQAGQIPSFVQKVLQGRITDTSDTAEEKMRRTTIAQLPASLRGGERTGPEGQLVGADVDVSKGITIKADAARFLSDGAKIYIASDGQAIKAQVTEMTPAQFALTKMMETHADKLEFVKQPDGRARIELKTLGTHLSEKLFRTGEQLKPDATQGILRFMIQQQTGLSTGIAETIDEKSITATTQMDSNNQLSYLISAKNRNGIPVAMMTLKENDPRISATALALDRTAYDKLKAINFPGGAGEYGHAAAAVAGYVSTLTTALGRSNLIDAIARGDWTHSADIVQFRQNFEAERAKFRAELGPNADKVEQVIQDMARDHGPAGTEPLINDLFSRPPVFHPPAR